MKDAKSRHHYLLAECFELLDNIIKHRSLRDQSLIALAFNMQTQPTKQEPQERNREVADFQKAIKFVLFLHISGQWSFVFEFTKYGEVFVKQNTKILHAKTCVPSILRDTDARR
ncbi:hypothetical protein [Hallella bergensis]|uniref:hypothetical protein n=1 Tax=Hallella bergensis TaxID=242750 RepID=UPI0039904DE1